LESGPGDQAGDAGAPLDRRTGGHRGAARRTRAIRVRGHQRRAPDGHDEAGLRAHRSRRKDRVRPERTRQSGVDDVVGRLRMDWRPALEPHKEVAVSKSPRRGFRAKAPAPAVAAAASAPVVASAQGASDKPVKKVHWPDDKKPEKTPLFSSVVTFGNLVFVSGIGAHFEGDIKAHTAHVLDEMKQRLESVGSSME